MGPVYDNPHAVGRGCPHSNVGGAFVDDFGTYWKLAPRRNRRNIGRGGANGHGTATGRAAFCIGMCILSADRARTATRAGHVPSNCDARGIAEEAFATPAIADAFAVEVTVAYSDGSFQTYRYVSSLAVAIV